LPLQRVTLNNKLGKVVHVDRLQAQWVCDIEWSRKKLCSAQMLRLWTVTPPYLGNNLRLPTSFTDSCYLLISGFSAWSLMRTALQSGFETPLPMWCWWAHHLSHDFLRRTL
jgi:hypothetical protein